MAFYIFQFVKEVCQVVQILLHYYSNDTCWEIEFTVAVGLGFSWYHQT